MIQTEALRLTLQRFLSKKLKPADVLSHGFHQIKNLETGGLSSTPLSYGPTKSKVWMRSVLTNSEGQGCKSGHLSLSPPVLAL